MKLKVTYKNGYEFSVPIKSHKQAERFVDGSFHAVNCKVDDCVDCPFHMPYKGFSDCSLPPYYDSAEVVYDKIDQHELGKFYG